MTVIKVFRQPKIHPIPIELPNWEDNIGEAWAVHQLRTTANLAPHSRLADFVCRGLKRQI